MKDEENPFHEDDFVPLGKPCYDNSITGWGSWSYTWGWVDVERSHYTVCLVLLGQKGISGDKLVSGQRVSRPPAPSCNFMIIMFRKLRVQSDGRSQVELRLGQQERILRRREMVHLFQWYYPEGGWGFVVLACACVSHALAFGLQLGFGFPLAANVAERFSESGGWGDVSQLHLGRRINVTATELCKNFPPSKCSASHPKNTLWRIISASHSQNQAGMRLHYSVQKNLQ